jgi:uncharacterized protein DUF6278
MKLSSAVLLALLAIGVGVWLWSRPKRASEPKFKTTEELVIWLANEAVKDAAQNNGVKLDYSVDSIKRVDAVLGNVHDQYVKNPSSISVNGLGSAYGAYIGEVIRKSEPGAHWLRDDETGEKSYPIVWGPGQDIHTRWGGAIGASQMGTRTISGSSIARSKTV